VLVLLLLLLLVLRVLLLLVVAKKRSCGLAKVVVVADADGLGNVMLRWNDDDGNNDA